MMRNAKHQEIAKGLHISFYFCKPYHSWERGANENTNGLIRQYIITTDGAEVIEGKDLCIVVVSLEPEE